MDQSTAIADRIIQVCEEKNMSLEELAKKSDISLRTIYRMTHGMTGNRGIFMMISICDALGITLDEFFGSEEFKEFRK